MDDILRPNKIGKHAIVAAIKPTMAIATRTSVWDATRTRDDDAAPTILLDLDDDPVEYNSSRASLRNLKNET